MNNTHNNLLHWKHALSCLSNINVDYCIVDQRYGYLPELNSGTDLFRITDGNNTNNKIVLHICKLTGRLSEVTIYTVNGHYSFLNKQVNKSQIHSFLVKLLAKEERLNGVGNRSRELLPTLRKYYNMKAGVM